MAEKTTQNPIFRGILHSARELTALSKTVGHPIKQTSRMCNLTPAPATALHIWFMLKWLVCVSLGWMNRDHALLKYSTQRCL